MTPIYYGPFSFPEENKLVGNFVHNGIWNSPISYEDFCTMGVYKDGNLVAGTIYHNWHPDEGVIELTSYSSDSKWLTRTVIYSMFRLPFEVFACQMCVIRVSERNTRMVSIARRFGFSEYLIPRMRGRDEAEFIFTFTDDQWSNSRYNKGILNG